ncbi:MAG TPA: hypothetical protein VHC18_21640 [Amycolatopsis sp.]|nr:hypothetical protein [Amycolatopsis sp.]
MTTPAMDREEAMARVRTIWALSRELERSGHRDLQPRAAEIRSMAHYMLYDDDAGVEEDR